MPAEAKTDELDYIRSEIRQEIGLLNQRLNALMASQSFLVIAYASTLASANASGDHTTLFATLVPLSLALLGAMLVLEAMPSLKAAREAIGKWRQRESALVNSSADYAPYTLATNATEHQRQMSRQHRGSHFAGRAPLIMLTAWTFFAALPFLLAMA